MMSLALNGLESAINAYLRLDPETIHCLSTLSGKSIAIVVTDWNFSWHILPGDNGVELSNKFSGTADTTISGTLNSLFKLGLAKGDNHALFENQLSIEGDMELGQEIRNFFSQIDIDWEEHLSNIVGDIAAHNFGRGVKEFLSIGKKAADTLSTNLKDFLFYESNQLPTPQEVQHFIAAVSVLRNDVDRAEARVNRLLNKRSEP